MVINTETVIKKLQNEIREMQINSDSYQTNIPYMKAYKFKNQRIQMPQTDNPYLYIVLDGALRLHTPSGIMDYMAGQYSISKIDTPLSGTVLTFSEKQDFLALMVEFTVNDVITTVLDIDNSLIEKIMTGKMKEHEMAVSDGFVIQSVYRLFYFMLNSVPSEFIRKNILREIIYSFADHAENSLCRVSQIYKRQMKYMR